MSRPSMLRAGTVVRAGSLGLVIVVAAVLAVRLRLAGHQAGDDFALYLRQARSVLDGDVGAVIADNRFSVLNSDPGFSPNAYPWVWPLTLSPFVGVWGLTYDRLKLVEIAVFCLWLVLLHGIVRRRIGRLLAGVTVAVIGTAPVYLAHTDQLLSEFPHLAAVALVIWWYDRVRSRATLLTASVPDLVILGLLVTLSANTRREGIVLVGVIVVAQMFDVWRASRDGAGVVVTARAFRRALATPLLSFVVGAVVFQLLLPAELLPDNGNSIRYVDDRWREYPGILTDQLGLGDRPWLGVFILLLAAVGAVVGVRRRPALDIPLVTLVLLSAVAVGTHFRQIDRYWFQVTPWVLYFATVALRAAATSVERTLSRQPDDAADRSLADLAAAVPLVLIVFAHVVTLPGHLSDVREFNAAGQVQDGPAHPDFVSMAAAVDELTRPDAVIAYYRARTMTLVTDRRAIQTTNAERIVSLTDYWVQRRDWSFWQPALSETDARALGMVPIWSNDRFVLWSTSPPD